MKGQEQLDDLALAEYFSVIKDHCQRMSVSEKKKLKKKFERISTEEDIRQYVSWMATVRETILRNNRRLVRRQLHLSDWETMDSAEINGQP